jgi:hypothetical protein
MRHRLQADLAYQAELSGLQIFVEPSPVTRDAASESQSNTLLASSASDAFLTPNPPAVPLESHLPEIRSPSPPVPTPKAIQSQFPLSPYYC